jgi:hypothetical protein
MLGRHKLSILIATILLIPILLGMPPLTMAHKLASEDPFTHCRQAQWSHYCSFHSFIPHDDPTIVSLNVSPLDRESTPTFNIRVLDPDSLHPNTTFNFVPLRC